MIRFPRLAAVLLLSLVGSFALAQDKPQEPEVDPKAVDAAIDKGVQWLLKKYDTNNISEQKYAELVLLTLIHAGLRSDHPILVQNFNKMLNRGLSETYNAGVRGLLLEKVNRKFYQQALAEIAMFFIDGQCENGQWTYTCRPRKPGPSAYAPHATGAKKKDAAGGTQVADEGPAPGKELKLPPASKRASTAKGDNSNTQYALLGLFAASRAAVVIPKETWEGVEKWFESRQNADGGWGYHSADAAGAGGIVTDASSGSMTTAALTGLIVAKFYLGKEWKDAASVKKGIEWLGKNFAVNSNHGGNAAWHYYYLYGLERVGMISGLQEFGGHRWYKEGAEFLLKLQKPDGSWKSASDAAVGMTNEVTDTCFAILFLRRATPELKKPKDIATGDTKKKP